MRPGLVILSFAQTSNGVNKKILIIAILVLLITIPIGWYLLSPFFNNLELNEGLPSIGDNFESMDAKTREEFEKQTEAAKNEVMEKSDSMPSSDGVIARADMVARAHEVEGQALLVKSGDEYFLRFENLETINGPDLRIYLSSDLSARDIVDLGPIRATKGNVNYAIPAGTDLSKYKNAMIWCRAFSVLFSYAQF